MTEQLWTPPPALLFLCFSQWDLYGHHRGSGKRGEAGVEGSQVCLESQTVLHFPHISLQLSPAK